MNLVTVWNVDNGKRDLLKRALLSKEEAVKLVSDELGGNRLIIDINIIYIKDNTAGEHQIRIKEE